MAILAPVAQAGGLGYRDKDLAAEKVPFSEIRNLPRKVTKVLFYRR